MDYGDIAEKLIRRAPFFPPSLLFFSRTCQDWRTAVRKSGMVFLFLFSPPFFSFFTNPAAGKSMWGWRRYRMAPFFSSPLFPFPPERATGEERSEIVERKGSGRMVFFSFFPSPPSLSPSAPVDGQGERPWRSRIRRRSQRRPFSPFFSLSLSLGVRRLAGSHAPVGRNLGKGKGKTHFPPLSFPSPPPSHGRRTTCNGTGRENTTEGRPSFFFFPSPPLSSPSFLHSLVSKSPTRKASRKDSPFSFPLTSSPPFSANEPLRRGHMGPHLTEDGRRPSRALFFFFFPISPFSFFFSLYC